MEIHYSSIFLRKLKKLEQNLKDEVYEKIEIFKKKENHSQLKIHKLHGTLSDQYSFYVNYKIRIIFSYEKENKILISDIGDHDIYK